MNMVRDGEHGRRLFPEETFALRKKTAIGCAHFQRAARFSRMASNFQSASIMLAVLGILAGGVFYSVTTPWGKKGIDWLKIHIPVIGTMFIDTIMTRSTRIMATMLNTGVTLLDTLHIVENSCDNQYFKLFWRETTARVESGFQLSEAMNLAANSELIPPAISQMIKAGEKGGNLGSICGKISDFYDKKLKVSIKTVTTLIEPLMIVIMGCIVGTIAIALLLPIFKISTVMAH